MFYRIGFLILITAALLGCGKFNANVTRGSGKVTTENRAVNDFRSVVLAGVGDMTIMQSDSESLTITAEDNLIPLITSEVKNGVLTVGVKPGLAETSILPTQPIKYELHVKNLDSLELSGAGNITAPALKTENLKLDSSGAGAITLNQLDLKNLIATLSGAGALKVNGQGDSQSITLSGLGAYEAGDFKTKTASVNISGAGGATVWATDALDGKISGAGGISYYGSPQVRQSISGVGAIKQLGTK